ncbi:MAG: hypothetical protein Ta2A_07990 [Treponemataceae bacterium]|nr:MAG: hypothetical protein Ta2A_07990 [Treponemataceae bacterium]
MYKANIEYEYIVNGKKYYYDNNKFNCKTFYGKKNMAQKYLKNYDVGKNIDIKYDKNNPRNSIMKNQIYEIIYEYILFIFFVYWDNWINSNNKIWGTPPLHITYAARCAAVAAWSTKKRHIQPER